MSEEIKIIKPKQGTIEWKRIHQPWALPEEEKLEAYKKLFDCDWNGLILKAPGTRAMIDHDPEYGQLIADARKDPLALDRCVSMGNSFGVHMAGILAKDYWRRMALPPPRPEVPPENASVAKAHATKLFAAKRFADAADMYVRAIALLDLRPSSVTAKLHVATDLLDSGALVRLSLAPTPRTERQLTDEQIAHTLHANLAACRVKQHRWAEAIAACDEAILLRPTYEKAVMRRATAKRMLKDFDGAIADAEMAKELVSAPGVDAPLAAEVSRQADALIGEIGETVRAANAEKERQRREEEGEMLGEGEPIYGEHFDYILKKELVTRLTKPYIIIDEWKEGMVGMCRVEDDSKDSKRGELGAGVVNGVDFTVEASVRSRGAKRFLYYHVDITVPWRGLMYKRNTEPHFHHDGFRGVVRLCNINHWTDRPQWKVTLMERPIDGELPTCTPTGQPLQPMMRLHEDGTPYTPHEEYEYMMKRELPKTQKALLTQHGPKLVDKLLPVVEEAIAGLKEWLGEYRTIYEEGEKAEKRAKARSEAEEAGIEV